MSDRSDSPDDWGNDAFFCDVCNRPFRADLYDVSRQFERTIFDDPEGLDEVEVADSDGIAGFCSERCREIGIGKVLTEHAIRATYPGIGPVETCSRCSGPVDMATFHLAFGKSILRFPDWDRLPAFVLEHVTLAVVCNRCAPPPARLIEDQARPPHESASDPEACRHEECPQPVQQPSQPFEQLPPSEPSPAKQIFNSHLNGTSGR